jgi:hypothetical protein
MNKDSNISGFHEYTDEELNQMYWVLANKPWKIKTMNYNQVFEMMDYALIINDIIEGYAHLDLNVREFKDLFDKAMEVKEFDASMSGVLLDLIHKRANELEPDIETSDFTNDESKSLESLTLRQIALKAVYEGIILPDPRTQQGETTREYLIKMNKALGTDYKSADKLCQHWRELQGGSHQRTGFEDKHRLRKIVKDIEAVLPYLESGKEKAMHELEIVSSKLQEYSL